MTISIYVFAYRCSPNRMLLRWLARHGLAWRFAPEERGIERARNAACEQFLADAEAEAILMIDADMVPLPATAQGGGTDAILAGDAPVIWCPYAGRDGTPGHRNDLGCGCLRIAAAALRRIERPFFAFREQYPNVVRCECSWFEGRARAAGIAPEPVGSAGHLVEVVIDADGKFLWPADMGYHDENPLAGAQPPR